MKKIIMFFSLMFLFTGFLYPQKNQKITSDQYSNSSYKIIMNGEVPAGVWNNKFYYKGSNPADKKTQSNNEYSPFIITRIYSGCSTIFDYVSEGTPQNIIQDPTEFNRIHLVCMHSPSGDGPLFPNRRTQYYYSSDNGVSWIFGSNISDLKSGFPAITLVSDASALITLQTTGTGSVQTTKWYQDIFPQLASFSEILTPTPGISYLWPKTVATSNLSPTNKFVTVSSINNPETDSCAWITRGASSFSAWNPFNSSKAEAYSIARGTDGRIGIAYRVSDNSLLEQGSVYFMESTNNGTSFGTPIKIYNAVINPTGDSLGMMRGLQLVYQGNDPKVVFELIKRDNNGNYYPNSRKNHIRFWSNTLPGSDPYRSINIADTTYVGYHPYINTGTTSDLFACLCRPTIGVSSDGAKLFVAFMAPSNYVGGSADTISFMNTYIMYSSNSGSNWSYPAIINSATPNCDWTYPCISPINSASYTNYCVYMSILSDSIPGSYVNSPGNGESFAKYMIIKAIYTLGNPPSAPVLTYPPDGSSNISTTPTFSWQSVVAELYNLQVSTTNTFTNNLINVSEANTQYTPGSGILAGNTQYYWRVKGENGYGIGPWSSVWSFTTTLVSVQNYSNEIPTVYKLYNNFPNPFNPVTKIRFDLPKSSAVKLTIYDVTGKVINELINKKMCAGKFETEWNAKNYASGVYFYKLETENFSDIKKLVLIK